MNKISDCLRDYDRETRSGTCSGAFNKTKKIFKINTSNDEANQYRLINLSELAEELNDR